MYLSRLILNPRSHQVHNEIANSYEMHRTIMGAFPTPLPHNERVLFRIEPGERSDMPVVLVQSVYRPDWESVQQKTENCFVCMPQVRSLDGLNIKDGDWLRFRLRADPSKRVYYARREKSQRISLFSEKDRREWMTRKAQESGFSILSEVLSIRDAPYRTMFIPRDERTHKATINMVDYEGVLRVEDAEKFLVGLRQGIGPAKGLGCGLLSLARL
jgi:CRISPR system Cascade subunit CasE